MKKKFQKWTLAISAVYMFTLTLLWQIIRFFINGEFNQWSVLGAFLGAAPLVIINAIYVYRKKDNTPELDERVRNNMIKYIAYASQIIFLILMAVLTVISFMGIESISIIYLWIIVLINMLVIGVGAMIVWKR